MNGVVKIAILNGLVKEENGGFVVTCSNCGCGRFLKTRENVRRAIKFDKKCNSCSNGIKTLGKKASLNKKKRMSVSQTQRYSNLSEKKKTSKCVLQAMWRPEVRKKHIKALFDSNWIKVKTDKGQLELLEKWNRLGFNFEPNYQIKTDVDLFYVDGYDQKHNIVLEYDTKYHYRFKQQQKDMARQTKIIKILNPKIFWRYNSVDKIIYSAYRKSCK